MNFLRLTIYTLTFLTLSVFFTVHAQAATPVYYSVGQSVADLKTGTPTVTIASGVATFSAAQTGNIGVGDRITYNTTDIAYIASKTSTSVWNLVTKTGAVPADITDSTVVSIKHEYTSLSAAVTGAIDANHLNTTDLVTGNYQLNFPCYYDSAADTTAVTVSGYTTGVSNFIKIYTPNNTTTEANNSQRHQGKWDDGKYNLSRTSSASVFLLSVSTGNVIIIGIQLNSVSTGFDSYALFYGTGSASNLEINNSIIKGSAIGTGVALTIGDNSDGSNIKISNNIIYGFKTAGVSEGYSTGSNVYFYNNTIIDNGIGITKSQSNIFAKNNISNGNTTDYSGSFDASSTNNISQDATSPNSGATDCGGHSCRNQAVAFADAANKDFHLSISDTSAKNSGGDLSADSNLPITTDIDGQTRPTGANIVDIGADEGATAIYYSVGQNTTDHKTGTPTVTIASGVATFSVAQTATNLGVGDKVTYNTTDVAYIASKTSTSVWNLVTATGGIPADITDSTVVSIAHAYASLSAAEAGAVDATHLNTTDLVTGNYQLNFPCYYDSGADTTAVAILGYTTAPANYIKIYTPVSTTTEVNQNQRHQGKWDDGKFSLLLSSQWNRNIAIATNHVQVDGLQVYNSYIGSTGEPGDIIVNGLNGLPAEIKISNNILKMNSGFTGSSNYASGVDVHQGYAGLRVKVLNNIIYNTRYGIALTTYFAGEFVAYDNTIYNSGIHGLYAYMEIGRGGGTLRIKNNLINASGTADYNLLASTAGWATFESANNISSDATSPDTAFRSKAVSFADAPNKDFHLSPTDTAAKNFGVDLSLDSSYSFSNDIDGNTRPAAGTVWDIGADEAANAVYYSVGQNTNDHKTGAPRVTVDASGVATFDIAQTASNMGVGDVITYDSTAKCYISEKISSTAWKCTSVNGGLPTQLNNVVVASIAHSFASLSAAEAGAVDATHLNTTNLVTGNYQLNIPCYYDTGADTTAVTVDGYTTGPNNYIRIYTPNNPTTEANSNQRHNGKWDDGKYKLEIATNNGTIHLKESYTRIDGIQIKVSTGDFNGTNGIQVYGDSSSDNTASVQISNNIIRDGNSAKSSRIGLIAGAFSAAPHYVWNNLVYDFSGPSSVGIYIYNDFGSNPSFVYNNTVINCNQGLFQNNRVRAINNITQNCSDGFVNNFSSGSDYNISDLAADAPGANSKNSTTVSFADAANKDFHLSISDTAAKNFGVDLSSDSSYSFTTDIDGQTRPSSSSTVWDIGADEASAQIFYSVGQSASDLKTGTPTVTIASGVATFSAAQTGNIGVGDRVTYNTTDIAYIAGKTSTSVWTLITKTGAFPADITDSTVVSIKHEYTSLSAAVTGAVDANHLNTTDLVTGNYQLNFPCYYDSAADTTAVTVSGYTTGVSNFIKIYTPNNTTTEANNSQRHQGKWDDGKYNLTASVYWNNVLTSTVDGIEIDGLQIYNTRVGERAHGVGLSRSASSNVKAKIFSNNIVKSNYDASRVLPAPGIMFGGHIKIFNNLVYGFYDGINPTGGGMASDSLIAIHNNTIVNCNNYGIYVNQSGTSVVSMKNNITQAVNVGFSNVGTLITGFNISQDATSPDVAFRNKTVQFADAANKDFHLSISDTSAKNSGSDLSADSNLPITTDIDGQTRPTGANVVDIGADEAATAIYYSVGQNTNSHETGAGTVTVDVIARTATFSVAQTATNMGVGDLITYTGGSCYIFSKTSTTIWGCQNATGGAPTAATNADVTSIAHAYASLSAAEAGAVDATHLNTTDLVAGNYQLDFPCYYDSGADTTAVTVDGYTTGVSNYIKIYTPNNITTEVNQSQRHSGKWDDGKYRIERMASGDYARNIFIQEDFVKIEGIQFSLTSNDYNEAQSIYAQNLNPGAKIYIQNNIVRGILNTSNDDKAFGIILFDLDATYYVSNNIVYGFNLMSTTKSTGIYLNGTAFVYNNTIYDNAYGVRTVSGSFTLSNNLSSNNLSKDFQIDTVITASSSNNLSLDATAPASGTYYRNTAVAFADAPNKDFHLASTDAAAKGAGLDLQRDSYFAFDTDIDGQVRVNPWDIGADQFSDTVIQTQQSSPNLDSGLVGHWTFDGDDTSGNITKDISGNANNGTIISGATANPGRLGQGLKFGGQSSGSYVDMGTDSLGLTNAISVAAWVKSDADNYGRIASKHSGTSGWALMRNGDNNNFEWFLSNNGVNWLGGRTSANSWKVGQWYYVAAIYDGTNMRVFIDGTEDVGGDFPVAVTGNVNNSTGSLQIGRDGNYGDLGIFNGTIDDVRIYNRALSVQEITQLYNQGQTTMQTSQNNKSTDGLVGLWSFDGPDISGTTAYDRSGLGNNGTISGVTVVPGKLGQGLNLNGASNLINIGNPANLNFGDSASYSLCWWEKPNIVDATEAISKTGGGNQRIHFYHSSGFIYRWSVFAGPAISATEGWSNICYTYEASGANNGTETFYKNGSFSTTRTGTMPIWDNASSWYIGSSGAQWRFNGSIDEVRIYNRALSASEISNLYNTGKVEMGR